MVHAVLLALAFLQTATAEEDWLTLNGAGGLAWGTDAQPLDAVPRDRSKSPLPDSGFIGGRPGDRPDDLELLGPHPQGERRYLRYVEGRLVDAWMVRQGPIDTTTLELSATEAWRGPALGPGDGRLKGIGDTTSWTHGDRSVLHWRDRMSGLEILAVRTRPTGSYGVQRAVPLEPGDSSTARIRLRGSLKTTATPVSALLSRCFDQAPKPVEARITAVYDDRGRLGRVAVDSDSPALDADTCVISALIRTTASPRFAGDVELFRLR